MSGPLSDIRLTAREAAKICGYDLDDNEQRNKWRYLLRRARAVFGFRRSSSADAHNNQAIYTYADVKQLRMVQRTPDRRYGERKQKIRQEVIDRVRRQLKIDGM